jgi:hypothetical protein
MAEMRPQLHRRRFVAALGTTAAWTVGSAPALAEGGRVYRIGILETMPADRNRPNFSALLTSTAISKVRTCRSNTARPTDRPTGFLPWRPNSSGYGLT